LKGGSLHQETEPKEPEVGSIFKSQVLSSVIRMRPIKDIREMSVVWQLPSTEHDNSPTDLISYVLGKEKHLTIAKLTAAYKTLRT
jgi:hypothetical protein